jgi:hypothetical protein
LSWEKNGKSNIDEIRLKTPQFWIQIGSFSTDSWIILCLRKKKHINYLHLSLETITNKVELYKPDCALYILLPTKKNQAWDITTH